MASSSPTMDSGRQSSEGGEFQSGGRTSSLGPIVKKGGWSNAKEASAVGKPGHWQRTRIEYKSKTHTRQWN